MEREQFLMGAPTAKYDSLQGAITDIFGDGLTIRQRTAVSGGDINRAYCLTLSDGRKLFLKENYAENLPFFIRETEGLEAIGDTGTISVPGLFAYGLDGKSSFLLMDYIEPCRRNADYYEDFGRRLAKMHGADCSKYTPDGRFGFLHDNYIGAGYQENTVEDSWIGFFRERRLLPQIRRAERYFDASEMARMDRLLEKLEDILIEAEKPALLHGDLWSGNHMTGSDGRAWLIDPAVYVGHPEADIAMTELFGGFPEAFYEGYFGTKQRPSGYDDRRDIYNLYHLLNHLNLFGSSYLGSVMRTVNRYTVSGP